MKQNTKQPNSILTRISKDTLAKYINKIPNASQGILEPGSQMVDAGITTYSAFTYDYRLKRYKQVIIRQTGDLEIANKSTEANEIYNWMIKLLMEHK